MAIEFEYTIDGNNFRGKASGFDESLKDTMNYSFAVVRLCIKHRCDHILLDEQELEYKLSPASTYNLVKSIVAMVPELAWVAIVINPENFKDAAFFEDAAVNRGLHIRFFQDMDEAEAWLAEK